MQLHLRVSRRIYSAKNFKLITEYFVLIDRCMYIVLDKTLKGIRGA